MTKNDLDCEIVVALGGNLGNGRESSGDLLGRAFDAFPEIGLAVKAKSSFWRSLAWPDPADPPYLNAVCLVQTSLTPRGDAGGAARSGEAFRARAGTGERAAAPRSRSDRLWADGRSGRAADPSASARAHLRRFVMGPLAEIGPDWRHPVSGATASRLAADATIGRDAAPVRPLSALHKTPQTPM